MCIRDSEKAKHLASLFHKNFEKFADRASDAIKGAGPNALTAGA